MPGGPSATTSTRTIVARDRPSGRARASFGQLRLWFLQQLDPGSTAYHLQTARRITGALRIDLFEQAMNEVIRRHEVFRTTFEADEDEPVQVIAPFAPQRFTLADLSDVPAAAQWDEVRRWAAAETQRPFDLSRGPLFRPSLIRVSPEEHVLLCVMHHIVADGWSLQRILFREMAIFYRALLDGAPLDGLLPDLPIQYADFAEWQREQVDATQTQLEYWARELEGVVPLDLPTSRPRPAVPSFQTRQLRFSLPPPLGRALEELSRREGATLFMTLLAAFQVLLHRYAGQNDIAVGCPIAERNHAELEPIIGFLVNTIVVRGRFERNPTFREHLSQVRRLAIEALDNHDVPFDRLVGVLAPERDPGRHPLAQVLFQLMERLAPVDAIPGVSLDAIPLVDQHSSGFDLVVGMSRAPDRINGTLVYATELFDEASAVRLSAHYVHLLHEIVADPSLRVSELSLVDAAETRHLVVDLDNRKADLYPDRALHALFEEQADRQPDAVALTFGAAEVSYGALDRRANQIAHGLRALGADAGRRVAVLLGAGFEQIAALLGVVKTGAAFVCLDPRYPATRLAQIAAESRPDLLLADAESLRAHTALVDAMAPRPVAVLDLEPDADDAAHAAHASDAAVASDRAGAADAVGARGLPSACTGVGGFAGRPVTRLAPVDPACPAFVVYTSGSTGRPKGIVQSHRSFSQFMRCQTKTFSLAPSTRFVQWASCGYDASYCEIFGALVAGATLCLAEPAVRYDPGALAGLVRAAQVTHLQVVPGFARQLLQALPDAADGDAPLLPSLRHLFLAGEVLPVDLARSWRQRLPDARLYNLYGPSETVLATSYSVDAIADGQTAVPVGRAQEGRHVLLLDPRGALCPVGVDGEVYVRSPFLADGYLDRPAETARLFVPDPLGRAGGRLYRTGDRARWRDGQLHFLGRQDQQVKLRGNRVELGDVEAALARCPGVREAAVAVHEYGPDDARLVAYVAFDEQESAAAAAASEAEGDGVPASDGRYVDACRALYDEIYSLPGAYSPLDDLINTRSWTSSYTNRPLPEDDVRESIDDAAERILESAPARVLEIGAGTGLLTSRLAPNCEAYCATDISDVAVAFLRGRFAEITTEPDGFSVRRCAAHTLDDLADGGFDAVVLNLVTQHFPDETYLTRVMQAALRVTAPGGLIFVGGVRHLALLPICHASVQFAQAAETMTQEQVRQVTAARLAAEKDLAIAPAFFVDFLRDSGRAGHVRILPKGGRAPNEITRFQYDALLHLDVDADRRVTTEWQDWVDSDMTFSRLKLHLLVEMPEVAAFSGVPNARLREAMAVHQWICDGAPSATVAETRSAIRALGRESAVDPADLWKLGADLAYRVDVLWTRGLGDGAVDVLFHRAEAGEDARFYHAPAPVPLSVVPAASDTPAATPTPGPAPTPATAGASEAAAALGSAPALATGSRSESAREAVIYTNQPLRALAAAARKGALTDRLRRLLPDYMVPSDIVVLERLPHTVNGKLDRKALAKPEGRQRTGDLAITAPRTPVEAHLVEVWREVLRLDRVGIYDNFFDLGGHSLLATQVMNRVRAHFGVEIPLRRLLESPVIADLARLVTDARREMAVADAAAVASGTSNTAASTAAPSLTIASATTTPAPPAAAARETPPRDGPASGVHPEQEPAAERAAWSA